MTVPLPGPGGLHTTWNSCAVIGEKMWRREGCREPGQGNIGQGGDTRPTPVPTLAVVSWVESDLLAGTQVQDTPQPPGARPRPVVGHHGAQLHGRRGPQDPLVCRDPELLQQHAANRTIRSVQIGAVSEPSRSFTVTGNGPN